MSIPRTRMARTLDLRGSDRPLPSFERLRGFTGCRLGLVVLIHSGPSSQDLAVISGSAMG
jgi:hypothetical protein